MKFCYLSLCHSFLLTFHNHPVKIKIKKIVLTVVLISESSSIFFNKVSQSPCKVKGKNIVYAIILQRFKEISLLMFWFHSVIKWNIKIAAKKIQLDRIWDLNSTQYNNSKMTTIEFLELAKTNMCCVHILKYQTKYQTE